MSHHWWVTIDESPLISHHWWVTINESPWMSHHWWVIIGDSPLMSHHGWVTIDEGEWVTHEKSLYNTPILVYRPMQLTGFLCVLKGLPSTYNKDLQEDKQALFDTASTVVDLLKVTTGVVNTMQVSSYWACCRSLQELLARCRLAATGPAAAHYRACCRSLQGHLEAYILFVRFHTTCWKIIALRWQYKFRIFFYYSLFGNYT